MELQKRLLQLSPSDFTTLFQQLNTFEQKPESIQKYVLGSATKQILAKYKLSSIRKVITQKAFWVAKLYHDFGIKTTENVRKTYAKQLYQSRVQPVLDSDELKQRTQAEKARYREIIAQWQGQTLPLNCMVCESVAAKVQCSACGEAVYCSNTCGQQGWDAFHSRECTK